MLREHRDILRDLPRISILQARDRLIILKESGHSSMPLPAGMQDASVTAPYLSTTTSKGTIQNTSSIASGNTTTDTTRGTPGEDQCEKGEEPGSCQQEGKRGKEGPGRAERPVFRLLETLCGQRLVRGGMVQLCELVQKLLGDLKEVTSKFVQRRGDPTCN